MTSSSAKSKHRKTTKAPPNLSDSSLVLSDQEFPSLGLRTKANHSRTTPNDQHNASATPPTAITILKPKKRVAPITVATHSNRNVFGSPAFRSDNNLLNISSADDDGTIMSRKLLKTHIDEISRDFENEPLPERGIHSILHGTHKLSSGQTTTDIRIDLTKVERRNVLEKLICIHSAIIDLNLTTNFLTEIAYLLNLLNVDVTVMAVFNQCDELPLSTAATVDFSGHLNEAIEPHLINRPSDTVSMVTGPIAGAAARTELLLPVDIMRNNINNCVYFSLGVLNKQKHILALLDITTIKVLLDNERLLEFNEYIREFLLKTYSHKLKLESLKRTHDISFKPSLYGGAGGMGGGVGGGAVGNNMARIDGGEGGGGSIGNNINVFYQQENDTKDNFPSMKEFMAFRKQRDCFCNILR